MSDDSVSVWLDRLKAGDPAAARPLWDRYFDRLVRLARGKLSARGRRTADEEDIALSAFHSFCRAAEAGRFPRLEDRDDLWAVLVTLTERKAYAQADRANAAKRGGGHVRGDSVLRPAAPRPSIEAVDPTRRSRRGGQSATGSQWLSSGRHPEDIAVWKLEGSELGDGPGRPVGGPSGSWPNPGGFGPRRRPRPRPFAGRPA